jgi:hypothetical protein
MTADDTIPPKEEHEVWMGKSRSNQNGIRPYHTRECFGVRKMVNPTVHDRAAVEDHYPQCELCAGSSPVECRGEGDHDRSYAAMLRAADPDDFPPGED